MWNLTFSMFIMFCVNSMVYAWIKIRFYPASTVLAKIDAGIAIFFIAIHLWIMWIMYTVSKDRCAQLANAYTLTQSFKNKVSPKKLFF